MSTKEVNEEILLYTPENDTTSIDEASLNNITAQITQRKKWKQRKEPNQVETEKWDAQSHSFSIRNYLLASKKWR